MAKYQVRNKSNQFDVVNGKSFANEDAADAAAREVLKVNPTAEIELIQIIREYSGTVSVKAKEPETPTEDTQADPAP